MPEPLKVEFQTSATGDGAPKTQQQIQAVGQSVDVLIKKFAEVQDAQQRWNSDLGKLSNDQLLEVEAELRKLIETEQKAGKETDALKQKLSDVYNRRINTPTASLNEFAVGSRGASQAVGELSNAFTQLGSRNNAVKDVLEGLTVSSRGGAESVFGLAKATKGLSEILGGFKLGPIAGVLGAITVLFAVTKDKIVEMLTETRSLDRETARLDKSVAALKVRYEEIEKASAKSLEAQLSHIDKLNASYDDFEQRVDRSRKRIDELNAAQSKLKLAEVDSSEASKLAKANSPEAREQISRDAERDRQKIRENDANAALVNDRLQAQREIETARQQIRELEAARTRPSVDLRNAKDDAAEARSVLTQVGPDEIRSPNADRLRRAVAEADKIVEARAKALEDVDAKLQPQLTQLFAKIETAQTRLDVGAIDRKSETVTEKTQRTKNTAEDAAAKAERDKKINELGQTAQQAAEDGDFAAQDAAVAEIRKLRKVGAPSPAPTPATNTSSKPKAPAGPNIIQPGGGDLPSDKIDGAAKKIESAPAVDGAKLGESLDKLSTAFDQTLEQSQKSIDTTAASVAALGEKLPPPLDTSPFEAGVLAYHTENLSLHKESQRRIDRVESLYRQLQQQLANQRDR